MAAAKQEVGRRHRTERLPLTKVSIRPVCRDLLAIEHFTPWGRRIEYIDLALKQPVFVEYASNASNVCLPLPKVWMLFVMADRGNGKALDWRQLR